MSIRMAYVCILLKKNYFLWLREELREGLRFRLRIYVRYRGSSSHDVE